MTARQFASPNPEPGDEIQRVADPDGDIWKRTSKGWVAHNFGGAPTDWSDLLASVAYVIDVTEAPGVDEPAPGPPS